MESRLRVADLRAEPVSSMTWDADSNRVSFTSSTGGTWSFVYQIKAIAPSVMEEITPAGSVYYVREPNGALIARISGSGEAQTITYYHFDALGSTRVLTDADGEVTDTYSYDAWGNASHDTGATEQPYQYVGCLGYYAHVQDENLPLLQTGVRLYAPSEGRFTQQDPARYGTNLYAYVDNHPTTEIDPLGLVPTVHEGMYSLCAKGKKSRVRQWGKWCREEDHLDKWGFLLCLKNSGAAFGLAVTGVQATFCTLLCAPYAEVPFIFMSCWGQCMGVDKPDFVPTCDDLAKIRDCYKDNMKKKKVEYKVMYCSHWMRGTFYEWLDKPEPSGGGWKRCD